MSASLSILVIDDEQVVLEFVSDLLEFRGHRVTTALDGRSGLDAYLREGADVVVTDIQMPGLSGLDVIRELKLQAPDLRIIAFTGFETAILAEAERLGACATLTKPFSTRELLALVETKPA